MKPLFLLLLAALLAAPLSAQLDPAVKARVDSVFARFDKKDSPGCALGIMRNGAMVYSRGYGQATLEYDVPITPSTIFHVASVTKQFTAFAIALLAEEGKLSLDDDIRKHLPEMPDFGKTITIRQLVHHTSGLRDQWNLLALAGWRLDDVITLDHIMRLIQRQEKLNFEPGAEYLYCNTGYTLMAEIVSRVGGMPFPKWMEQRVFRPLGMNSSLMYDDHERIVPNRAYSYRPDSSGFKKSVLSYANAGATSLFTTVEDLARWADNFYRPKVGSAALIKQMQQRGVLNNGDTIAYAFGLSIGEHKGLPLVQHGGADAGYRTHIAWFPEQEYAVIVLSNLSNGNPGGLAMQVTDIVLEKFIKKPEPAKTTPAPLAIRMSPDRLNRYLGTFVIESVGAKVQTFIKSDTLFMKQLWDQHQFAVLPSSDTTFFIAAEPKGALFTFRGFSRGAAANLIVRQDGAEYLGKREEGKQANPDPTPYVGRYYSRELDTTYSLEVKADKLQVRHQRHPGFELNLSAPDRGLANQWFFGSVTFTRGDKGQVTGMKVSSGRVRDVWFERQ